VAKEFLQWLAGHFKTKQLGSKLKSVLFKIILNGLLKVILDIPIIAFFGWLLYGVVASPSPLSRMAVFEIALCTVLLFLFVDEFFDDLGEFLNGPRRKKARELEQTIVARNVVAETISLLNKGLKESNDSLAIAEKVTLSDASKEIEKAKQ
jgi:hypothetical protein